MGHRSDANGGIHQSRTDAFLIVDGVLHVASYWQGRWRPARALVLSVARQEFARPRLAGARVTKRLPQRSRPITEVQSSSSKLRSQHPLPLPGRAKAFREARAKTKPNARAWQQLSNHFDNLFTRRMKSLMLIFSVRFSLLQKMMCRVSRGPISRRDGRSAPAATIVPARAA